MSRSGRTLGKSSAIVIAGYFGFGNLGDELILAAMINSLRAQKSDLTITVLSGNPKDTQKTHRVESIAWEDYVGIVQAVSTCDLVILGGGGLFHDYWGVEPQSILTTRHSGFAFYTSIALLASIHKKKLMLSAVGVGPLLSEQGRQLMKAIAAQADLITVRDPESMQQLISLGIPGQKISLTADAVFSLDGIAQSGSVAPNESPLLGVSLRHWDVNVDPVRWQHETALALDQFLDAHPTARVLFIPFQRAADAFLDDHSVAKSIQGSLKNKNRASILPKNAGTSARLAAISQCDLFLGMRLHSIILALMNHIPVIGIRYDPKVQALLQQFQLEKNLVCIDELESTALFTLLEDNWLNRSDFSDRVQKQIPQVTALASRNYSLAVQLLQLDAPVQPLQSETAVVLADAALSLSTALEDTHQQNLALEANNQELSRNLSHTLDQKAEISTAYEALQALQQKTEIEKQASQTQYDLLSMELHHSKAEAAHLLNELDQIKTSRGWKLLFKLWQLRLVFIPKGSKREAVFKKIIHKDPQGRSSFFQKAARWMKRRLNPKLSWPSLAFRTFQMKRRQLWPQNLNGLTKTSVPGLVSIILPVHNGEKYVAAAIQSILDQSYTNFELIIVDDGSTDATASILQAFEQKDRRITVIHQANLKLPGALNTGFASARGEFLTWTSDDNLFTPQYIEKMTACLRRHPAWDMIFANMDLIDEEGKPLRNSGWYEGYQFPHRSEHIYLPTDPSELNVIPNNTIGGAFMYRRHVADLLAGYSPFQYTREDYDYWMQVNSLFTLRHTDFKQPIYKYRMHFTSLTSQDAALKITEERKFLMTFEDFRRDFYLMPLVWVFEDDQLDNPAVAQMRTSLQNRGQVVMIASDLLRHTLPIQWIPCIQLKICATLEEKDAFLSAPQEYGYKVAVFTNEDPHAGPVYSFRLAVDQHVQTISESSGNLEASLKAVDLKCRSLALRKIESLTWQPQPTKYKISVVICTYNRSALLEHSLRAIAHQTIAQSEYEVIVVDNNPGYSELAPLIEQTRSLAFSQHPDCLRLVQCPIKGLSFARNAGIAEARGEWVLFLDDDALAEPDLVEKYLEAIKKHPGAGLIGGHILLNRPEHLEMPWQPGWERYWSHFETGYREYTEVSDWYEFPWGANWCARRKVLFQIGGFRGAYGRRGEDYSGGEEIIAASLIQTLGYSIGILPQARVIHQVDPARFSLQHLKHTIQAGQLVRYQAELDHYLPMDLSLPINPVQLMKKLKSKTRKTPNDEASVDQSQKVETAYILSAKRKLMQKHLLTECARFKILYPLIKKFL